MPYIIHSKAYTKHTFYKLMSFCAVDQCALFALILKLNEVCTVNIIPELYKYN